MKKQPDLNDVIQRRQERKERKKKPRCACGKVASYIVIGEGVPNGCECIECHWKRKHV